MSDPAFPDTERARAILETLSATGPATTAELAAALESHPVTVERRCRALQRAGHIRLCTAGTYAIVESGPERDPATSATDPAEVNRTPNPAD